MGFSLLLTKQRSSRRSRRARVSLARAPACLSRPPTLPAPPLRAHSPPPLPPPRTPTLASAAGPSSCACPPALPLLGRVRVSPGLSGRGGWGQRELERPTRLPALCGTVMRLRAVVSGPARRASQSRRACAEQAALRRWWRWRWQREVGGWGGWWRGLRGKRGRGPLRLRSEASKVVHEGRRRTGWAGDEQSRPLGQVQVDVRMMAVPVRQSLLR